MSTTESTTWNTIRGTLLHRAVLHPAAFLREVDTDARRKQYSTYSADLAKVIHDSLSKGDFTLARLVVSAGGPSWGTVVDDFQALSEKDRALVLNGFEDAAANMTKMLMMKAWEDGWLWVQTEVSSPYAAVHGLAHKGCRIDVVAKRRSTSDDTPTLVVADLKTGEDHSEAHTANTYLRDVATKYGTWFATETDEDVQCMVLYARTDGGYSSWSDRQVIVHPGESDLDTRLDLEHAVSVARTGGKSPSLEDFLACVPKRIDRAVATAWHEEHVSSAA